jgi:hypothetical protein
MIGCQFRRFGHVCYRCCAGFVAPLLANRQAVIYYSQLIHRRKMYVISALPHVGLGDEFRVLVEDTGKFAGGARCFSSFIRRTL